MRRATSTLATIDHLETVPIDVSGLNASRSVKSAIFLPDGVTMLRPVDATATITITALSGTRPFPSVAIVVANLGPGLAAEVDSPVASVVLAGPLPALAAADQLTALVDAAGKGPGTYPVDVVVRPPPGATVQTVQPGRVMLTIRAR